MSHVRKQIRSAVEAVLTGLVTTGANVFVSRSIDIPESKLPCLLIYTNEENSEPISMGSPRRYENTVMLDVQAIVQKNDESDDLLDTIAVEVEVALNTDLTLGGLVTDIRKTSFEADFIDKAKIQLGRATMKFEVDYETLEGDPETSV